MWRFLLYIGFIFCNISAIEAKIAIALIAPKAENYAQQGQELNNGVQRAIDEINSNGGLLGEKVELLSVDDQCNDSIAISTAQMLTILKDRKIRLIIGPYCANSFDKVADIYSKAQIFQIIPTTVNYTQAKTIKKGLVKMLGYTDQEAKDFFDFYNQKFAGKNVAIISNETDVESTEKAIAIMKQFSIHGKSSIIKHYTYSLTNKDYQKLAQIVQNQGAQIAFLLGTSKNIRKTARYLKENDDKFILFTNRYAATKDYFDYLGNLANGTYFMELRGKNEDPDFAETLVKLRLSGFDVDGLALYGYSAVKLWESLVKKSKSFDYNKLSAHVNDKTVKTEFGNKMFHNGAPKISESYAVYQYEDEKYAKIY